MGAAQEEDEGKCRAEELREIDKEVLVARVDAMLGEVGGVGVVEEVVEWCNDGVRENARKSDVARGIRCSIDADGYEGCEESRCSEEEKGKRPGGC